MANILEVAFMREKLATALSGIVQANPVVGGMASKFVKNVSDEDLERLADAIIATAEELKGIRERTTV